MLEDTNSQYETLVLTQEEIEKLRAELDKFMEETNLSEQTKETFRLKYYAGMSIPQIMARQNILEGTVKSRTGNVLTKIRSQRSKLEKALS